MGSLGFSLEAQGKRDEAAKIYASFVKMWGDADEHAAWKVHAQTFLKSRNKPQALEVAAETEGGSNWAIAGAGAVAGASVMGAALVARRFFQSTPRALEESLVA